MSHSHFTSFLDCFSASFFQFLYGLVSYYSNSYSNSVSMSCTATVKFSICFSFVSLLLFFQFPLLLSISSEFPYRLSSFSSKCSLSWILETPPSPPAPDPVGIENCKQLFSPLLAFTTQKIATHSTDIISAARVAFFWVVNVTRNEKSCLQFLIPTAVFHMLLRGGSTRLKIT